MLAHKVTHAWAADLLLAIQHQLDADRHRALLEQGADGEQVAEELRFVVGAAPGVDATVAHHRLERGRGPGRVGLRGLHVVVPVHEHAGSAGAADLRVHDGVAADLDHLRLPAVLDQQRAQEPRRLLEGLAAGADAGYADGIEQVFQPGLDLVFHRRGQGRCDQRRLGATCTARPSTSRAPSASASGSVGCACTAWANSEAVSPWCSARVASAIRSVARGPMMATPRR